MSEENNTGEQQGTQTSEQQNQQTTGISISKEEYAQLQTTLALLQDQNERLQATLTAKENPPPDPTGGKDINQLTNAELIQVITKQVSDQVATPLLNTIMQLAVKEEVRDLGDKYDDFKTNDDVRKAVFGIAEENTSLSLEQAYLIYKGKAPAPKKDPKPAPVPPPGEKPGVNGKQVEQNKAMSVREAAEAAFKSLGYTDPS